MNSTNKNEILFDGYDNLEKHYRFYNKEEIIAFLEKYPYLVYDLYSIIPLIRKYFKSNGLSIKFVPDYEYEELDHLVIFIEVNNDFFKDNWKLLCKYEDEMLESKINFLAKTLFYGDIWWYSLLNAAIRLIKKHEKISLSWPNVLLYIINKIKYILQFLVSRWEFY